MKVITGIKRKLNCQGRTALVLSLMAVALMACTAAVPIAQASVGETERYTCLDNSFTVLIPKGWAREENGHPYGDLTKISGIRLTGPIGPEGVPPTITVRHYSGEQLFKSPDEFIHNALNSIVRIDYQREATLADVQIAGRPGKQFHIKTFELVYLPQFGKPPMPEGVVYEIVPPHKQVDMTEQYIVVPARQGYFVLGYRAPIKNVEEYQLLFGRVVESFLPQVP
jgi:hypothetical protein